MKPLRGHQHAHWLPLDLDNDGRIEHVLVYAPMGLNEAAQQALCRIERTYGKGLPEIVVSLAGLANLDAIRRQLRDERGNVPGELATSAVWESRTPFLAPRHLKRTGKNSIQGQVQAECQSRGMAPPIRIEVLPREELVSRGFHKFIRSRSEKEPPQAMPFCLRLTFDVPKSGPISLGYASHFGLGLFKAVD